MKTEGKQESLLRFFRKEKKDLQEILSCPFNAGIYFSLQVKKAVSPSGKYIVPHTVTH